MATVLEMIHNAASELRNQRHKGVAASFLKRLFGGSKEATAESTTTAAPSPSMPVPTERVFCCPKMQIGGWVHLGNFLRCTGSRPRTIFPEFDPDMKDIPLRHWKPTERVVGARFACHRVPFSYRTYDGDPCCPPRYLNKHARDATERGSAFCSS